MRAQLELAQGNLDAAIGWADTNGLSIMDEDLQYPREGQYLALARVRMAQARGVPTGTFLQDILHLLNRQQRSAEAKVRMGSVLEILIVRALALEAQGDRTIALSTLERALVVAEPRATSGSLWMRGNRCGPCHTRLMHAAGYPTMFLPYSLPLGNRPYGMSLPPLLASVRWPKR